LCPIVVVLFVKKETIAQTATTSKRYCGVVVNRIYNATHVN